MIAVTRQRDAQLTGLCEESQGSVRIAIDGDGQLAGLLNAAWKPRAYLLDAGGRLVYVQPDTTLDSLAVLQVGRLLGGGSLQVPEILKPLRDQDTVVAGGGRPVRPRGKLLRGHRTRAAVKKEDQPPAAVAD